MSEIPSLISDLAVILIAAGVVTLLFKMLKQPVVLGYIVAGLLAGPAIKIVPTITNTHSIQTWADIGVIFLLFALGLDFSFKKLMKVGGTAIIGAVTIVIGMMTLGYTTAMLLGWGHSNGLFLGGMLSMSSTTIIIKAFDDLNLRNQRFASVVFGILVVEDLFAVLLMVLLSTLSVSKHVEGMELFYSVLKLTAFVFLSLVIGITLIPSLLRKVHKYLNDETLLIVSLGLCLGMVIIATKAGFSAALGAFVMGSILAETIDAENIERIIKPVKDLFGAIFFVSVGMLIEPSLIWQYIVPIIILTFVVMFGQILFGSFGVLLSGQPMKIAIQSGFSLAQIGEFAFIIASLGQSLGVTAHFLYPIVVAVSVVTTFFTPYMIRLAGPANKFAERIIPAQWLNFLNRYSSGSNTVKQKSYWNKLIHALLLTVGIYLAISLILIFLWLQFASPWVEQFVPGIWGKILSLVLIVSIVSPMLRAIMMKKNHSEEFQHLWNDSKYNRGPLVSLVILRILICVGVVMIPVVKLLNIESGLTLAIATTVIVVVILSRRLKRQSIAMERRFLTNLKAREAKKQLEVPINQRFAQHLLDRNLHLADFEVRQDSPSVGKTLKELDFRKKCNINVVTIIRGRNRINIPGGEERIYPFDKLIVVGDDEDLVQFREFVFENYKHIDEDLTEHAEVNMEQFVVGESSSLIGRTIRESGIRDNAKCLVVGIERGGGSIKNPVPQTVFEEGDIVWIVGEHDKVVQLSEGHTVNE